MDPSDKPTNKAMSAPYKYLAFQTFAIPTEGDNDADAHTHEVTAKMDVSRLADWLTGIDDCTTEDELKEVFGQAYKAAQNDKDALKRIIAAKDAKKAKL